jgi:exopolysaccharide biosynthesis polyprenyl glycosylphosphotransferase
MRVFAIKILSFACDCVVIFLSYYLAAYLRLGPEEMKYYYFGRFDLFFLMVILTGLVFYISDVYPNYKKFLSFFGVMLLWNALVYVFLFQGFVVYLSGSIDTIGRGVFTFALLFQTLLFTVTKGAISLVLLRYGPKERAIIVGYNPWKEFYFDFLKEASNNGLPLQIVGIVSDDAKGEFMQRLPFGVLGPYEDIEQIVKRHQVNTLILTSTYAEKDSLQEFLIMAHHNHSRLITLDQLYEDYQRKVPYNQISRSELLNECLLANRFAQLKKKRVVDVILSLILVAVLFPLACLIALGIKLTSRGNIFYVQDRVGFRGDGFKMLKFRTMRMNAEEGMGAVFTERSDPRVTPFGRFLRNTHLDEIPQVLNVLKGDMSLVGPRPEREEFIRKLEKRIPIYALRLFTKPGITGWAQVAHGYAATVADLEEKFCYDLYYLKHMTISFDIKILLLTLGHFLFAKGR